MVVDHVGVIWWPAEPAFRVIGRLAYPAFLLLVVDGIRRTRGLPEMVSRFVVLAAVSEFPHFLAFGTFGNVVWGLCAAVCAFGRSWPVAGALAVGCELLGVEYGAASVLCVWLAGTKWREGGWLVGSAWLMIRGGWWTVLGWTGFPLVLCAGIRVHGGRRFLPAWASVVFYPVHLLVLVLVRWAL